jgi:acetyl-CoA carboxylase biotin carboxyl carrier protein
MNLPLLERLVRLMADNGLTDIQLKDGDQRIILSRAGMGSGMGGGMGTPMSGGMMPVNPVAMPSSPSETEAAPTSMAASRPTDTGAAAGLIEIKSPMVGTFYASPSPDARPFVQVGDRVSPDSDVCIIEAMKVFNNIKAETSGTIASIQAENGQAVEYGQVLFLVRPA